MHYPQAADIGYPYPEYYHNIQRSPQRPILIKQEHIDPHSHEVEASNKLFVGGRLNRGITPGILII
jgi:hypothetical protein